jgi:hypothetical protein
LVRDAGAAINSLVLKGNFPCGRISKDNDGQAPWLPGKDFEGWTAMCSALAISTTITHVDVSECMLGPEALTPLADAIKVMAALIKVDVSGNSEIGGEGKTALQTAIQGRQPTIELVV